MSKKGYKQTKIHKQRIGDANKGKKRPDMEGENNPRNRINVRKKIDGENHYMKQPKWRKWFSKNNPMRKLEARLKVSSALKDKSKSYKHRQELSKIRIERKLSNMKNNPNWRGGISFEPYSFEFNKQLKEFIRKRDNCQCQFCGNGENSIPFGPHHINYNKKDCRERNLILLCNSCNSKANYERDKWQLYFTVLQELRGV